MIIGGDFRMIIDAAAPGDLELHLILDNYGTHKTLAIKRWLLRHPRFHLHFTPTSNSWLNLVERWFAALTEKQLRRGAHRSTRELADAIRRSWKSITAIPNPSSGPKPLTKSSNQLLDFVNVLQTQDTRGRRRGPRDAQHNGCSCCFGGPGGKPRG